MLNSTRTWHAIVAQALGALLACFSVTLATPSHAQEYVKICSANGAGYFIVPGTDTPPGSGICLNANQIVTDQFGIAREQTRASTGTAMAASMVNPFLPKGTNYAISTHWAVFNGQHAVGFSGLMRLQGNLSFTAGIALGLDRGNLLTFNNRTATENGVSYAQQSWSDVRAMAQVGLQYAW